jgi:hypothetical protein
MKHKQAFAAMPGYLHKMKAIISMVIIPAMINANIKNRQRNCFTSLFNTTSKSRGLAPPRKVPKQFIKSPIFLNLSLATIKNIMILIIMIINLVIFL